MDSFDVVVIGGGHAGCEAAAAAARMGVRAALLTMTRHNLGAMSCNPAIGGVGKGHLVREVDAWDGLIGRAADAAAIHYRMLNQSKGAAVRGPRVQADRKLYSAAIQQALADQERLTIIEGEVVALALEAGAISGVLLADGSRLAARAVVLATGTFLNGRMYRGAEIVQGGRTGERASLRLAEQIKDFGLSVARLKTGTPPRIRGRSIDWAVLERQPSDSGDWTMSPLTARRVVPQLFCAITRTNPRTHEIVRNSSASSPLFSGAITGTGPRYCPSIEDKVRRFADRDGHQIFLEPEGITDDTIYPNGISTSLPAEAQIEMIRSIHGLEHAEIAQPGYAVEYDHVDPRAVDRGLAVRTVRGLYLAGQVNGTTGYEEAAAQGLVAGVNAARAVSGETPVIFERWNSLIGVMIDDLTLQGVTEPYRMLTARAEYRLRLRSDNAATRLTQEAMSVGCVGDERTRWFARHRESHRRLSDALRRSSSVTSPKSVQAVVRESDGQASDDLIELSHARSSADRAQRHVLEEVLTDLQYAPYVERQERERERVQAEQRILLGPEIDYRKIAGLSTEMIERLETAVPETVGAASRIAGITPAAVVAILIHSRHNAA